MIGERSFQRCSDCLDKTIDEGWADKDNLLITGGSYAGYLTAWIISHDNRFKAACAQRGVYDLTPLRRKCMEISSILATHGNQKLKKSS
jgi:dipeptidyl aminopeptidase/acylaminoacyl peptidase